MKISLRPHRGQVPDGIIPVGEADGRPFGMRGRDPYVLASGTWQRLEGEGFGRAMLTAVEEAASAVFGDLWIGPMVKVTGLGNRTCQRDRIVRFGLPTPALRLLAEAANSSNPRAVGYGLLLAAEVAGDPKRPLSRREWVGVQAELLSGIPTVAGMLSDVRDDVSRARVERLTAAARHDADSEPQAPGI